MVNLRMACVPLLCIKTARERLESGLSLDIRIDGDRIPVTVSTIFVHQSQMSPHLHPKERLGQQM